MRRSPALAAGLYSASVTATVHPHIAPAAPSLPGLFIVVDASGRIIDSLVADEALLTTPTDRINGRRVERVLWLETATLISEALKSTSDSHLIFNTEYDQETDEGTIRLNAEFVRAHKDRLTVKISRVNSAGEYEVSRGNEDLPDLAAFSELLMDREFVAFATEVCQLCCSQFKAKTTWLGFPVGSDNAIWLNGWAQTYSPAGFNGRRIQTVLESRRPSIGIQKQSGKKIATGLFPLLADGKVLALLGITGEGEDFLRNEQRGQLEHFTQLIGSSLKYLMSLLTNQPRMEQIQALRDIDQAILSSLNLHETANIILETALQRLVVDAADILILNPHTRMLDYLMGLGFRSSTLQHTHLKLGESYAGIAARDKCVVHIRDLRRDSQNFSKAYRFESESFYTYVGIPLIARGEVKGVLEVFKRNTTIMDPARVKLLEMIAAQIAIAIDNSALVERLGQSHQDLASAHNATIEGLSRALELRDRETEGHAHRVADFCTILAMRVGIGGAELEYTRQGALLHDIGKIGIPDKILRKPGKLNLQEWSIMKQHPLYAYNVLSQIEYLKPALAIPLHHHERWDGTGYPHGLAGENIPLPARVFAVVDVYDALTSDRPYRPAWSKEQAIEYISSQSGLHFDPHVVETFTEIIGDF